MTKLDKAKFDVFLKAAMTSPMPKNFGAVSLVDVLNDNQIFLRHLATTMMAQMIEGGPLFCAGSIWGSGFEFGRAYEQAQRETAELDKIMGIDPDKPKRKRKVKS